MKLIDKNLLIEQAKKKNYSRSSIDFLQSQKEIKAIPVDFIQEFANKHLEWYEQLDMLVRAYELSQEEGKDFVDWLNSYDRWKREKK